MPRSLNISLFILILFLIILRFISLEIDPPNFFAGYTQAHLTDPYHLTFFARNAILFDDSNPFDFYRWNVFKYSLIYLVLLGELRKGKDGVTYMLNDT